MNSPCPICNHLHQARLMAFVRREYKNLERLENEHAAHLEKCEVVNSSWYLGLWSRARLGVDVYPDVESDTK